MKTKKKSCRRGNQKRSRSGCKKSCRKKKCWSKQSGGAMCATGLCGVTAGKIGSLIAAGGLTGYKVFSMGSSIKTKKGKGKKNKLFRHQKFKYIDNSGKEIDFEIRQQNKKIIIKNGKKKIEKIYKQIKSATNRYNRKIKECEKKGFDKC